MKTRTLAAALDNLPDDAFAGSWKSMGHNGLRALLRLPATTESLGRLFPLVTAPMPPTRRAYEAHVRALGWYAQAAVRAHALTYVRPTVDAALRALHAATRLDAQRSGRDGARGVATRTIAWYHRFLRCLAMCDVHGVETALRLPAAVQEQMGVVVAALIKELEGLSSPEMPSAGLDLRPVTLNALLSPRLLTLGTVKLIIAHAEKAGIEFTSSQWLAAATVYLHEGKTEEAFKCLAHAGRGVDLDFSHRLMAAQGASTLTETVMMLEPIVAGLPVSADVGEVEGESEGEGDDGAEASTDSAVDSIRAKTAASNSVPPTQADSAPRPSWSTTMRAWSILLARAATDQSVTAKQLSALADSLPEDMAVSYTVTPVMHGLVSRGDVIEARRFWRALQNRYTAAPQSEKALFLDAPALSVGTELQFQRGAMNPTNPEPSNQALKHSLTAVDYYGRRPRRGHRVESERPHGGRSIRLDTQTLNVLLHQAARAGRPGIAFRLWEAARPRWGIWHDDISLTLMLDMARTCVDNGFDPGLDTFRGRLRALASALHPSKSSTYTPPSEVDWRTAPLKSLLDPPRYSWHEEHGPTQPWTRARALFRAIVLGNWPALASVTSPLGARSFLGIADLLSPRSLPGGAHMPPPSPDSAYAHIIPSAATWQAYMSLLRRYGEEWGDDDAAEDEVATALGWMRALGVKPTWRTGLEALVHVGEHEGARRRVRIGGRTVLARDEEILRAWLKEWCGNVPDESEVAALRRQQMSGGRY